MTKISDICRNIEQWAPPVYAEAYDNIGLIAGDPSAQVTGILVCLDSTEEVVEEAIRLGCNLVLAHHPIVFRGLKKFNGSNYVERTIIYAIKNDIAIYAAHTNLDNVLSGVNYKIAHLLGLQDHQILSRKPSS
ncbi:MAG: Nif3-like dinuclear metal center hexameric protein, partial [Saprospiraceae bacterium]